jgi:SAM-dependent methyltransferase
MVWIFCCISARWLPCPADLRAPVCSMADAQEHQAHRSIHIPYAIQPEESRSAFYENYWKKVALELLLKHASPQGKTVLDFGCGRGETVQIFRAAGFDAQGTDMDPECVRLTRQFGPAVVLESDNVLGQFGRDSFDIVTSFHVLEHVENPKKTLSELAQVAREYVLLAVPNLRYLHRVFDRRIDKNLINAGHLQSWDHWHLLNLAERYCQLELVEWGFDATALSGLSNLSEKFFGNRFTIWLETGLFRKLFPFHGISIIGLFRVKKHPY